MMTKCEARVQEKNKARSQWLFIQGFLTVLLFVLVTGCQTATPKISPPAWDFTDSRTVRIGCDAPGGSIYYTTDGSKPGKSSNAYNGPFALKSSAMVKSRTISGISGSDIAQAAFRKYPQGATNRISISSEGYEGNHPSWAPKVSATGRFVVFASDADRLVAGDTNGVRDIFVFDTEAHQTIRVSVGSSGVQANAESHDQDISADGRYVVFSSKASNLVPGDTNGLEDVFVYDIIARTIVRVSVTSSGSQITDKDSQLPAITDDGRFVVFESESAEFVKDDTNKKRDVFIHDLNTRKTARVSINSKKEQGNDNSTYADISGNGRYVVFQSRASNLVRDDTNNAEDIFIRDRKRHTTSRISTTPDGNEGNNGSFSPSVSSTGRTVAFMSLTSNLVSNDTNGLKDIFVRDLYTGSIERVSVDSTGTESNGHSINPSMASGGKWVAFQSVADNLVVNDTNGQEDVFIHHLESGRTYRVSVSSTGQQGEHYSKDAAVSGTGQFVAFESWAQNLVPGDRNAMPDVFLRDLGASGKR